MNNNNNKIKEGKISIQNKQEEYDCIDYKNFPIKYKIIKMIFTLSGIYLPLLLILFMYNILLKTGLFGKGVFGILLPLWVILVLLYIVIGGYILKKVPFINNYLNETEKKYGLDKDKDKKFDKKAKRNIFIFLTMLFLILILIIIFSLKTINNNFLSFTNIDLNLYLPYFGIFGTVGSIIFIIKALSNKK